MTNLKNMRFQHLIVESFLKKEKRVSGNNGFKYISFWNCVCDCGRKVVRTNQTLKDSNHNFCGICDLGPSMYKSRVGEQHGLLTVISFNRVEKELNLKSAKGIIYTTFWNCLCDCGETCVRSVKNFNLKYSLHCGNIACKRRITSCNWRKNHSTDLPQNLEQSMSF